MLVLLLATGGLVSGLLRAYLPEESTMANVKLTAEQIITRGEQEGFTSYQIAVLINVKLAEANVQPIRPQMMYNYSRNGMISKGKKGDMTERYTTEEVMAFIQKFTAKRIQNPKYQIQTVVTETEETECEGQMALEI